MKHFITIILSILLLASCAPSSKQRPMNESERIEYQEIQQKITELEHLLLEFKGMESSEALSLLQLANQLKLSYDINSSIMGMQSSNGRIPVKDRKSIYLSFENERTHYNSYVWVEVLAAKPINEHFKSEYYIN